jgi:hypothetical protein
MHIHSIWGLWNTFHRFDIDVKAILNGSISMTALSCGLLLRTRQPEFYVTFKSDNNESLLIIVRWNTAYVFYIDVWAILNGSTASSSSTALHFSLLITRQPEFKVISIDIFQNKRDNCFVRTDPYAHPQHMKIVKQLICVWHWYVSHLELVYSLNDNTTTLWFACRKTPRILVNVQTLLLLLLADKNGSSMVRTHPHAHPQHMKVVRHHMCLVLMWEPFWMGIASRTC